MSHSLFTIVGPVMVGPSSSHTAGAVRLGQVARALFGEIPDEVDIVLYQSFGEVYDGHGTDGGLVAGVLGIAQNDLKMKQAFELAAKKGVKVEVVPKPNAGKRYHPNSAKFYFRKGDRKMSVLGSSVGGGLIEIVRIDDMNVSINGEHDLVVFTARDDIDVLELAYETLKPAGAKLLQLFSHEKASTGYSRHVMELSKTPDTLEAEFKDTVGVTRVSLVPHINLWECVDCDVVPSIEDL